jgi:ABC-2 type transport system permease protein
MVISFLAVGLLPFVGGWEEVTRAFPWHYYNGSDPVTHGVHWAHLGILAGAAVALGGIAVAGVRRRDLKEHGVAVTLLDRLRNNPRTRKVIEKIAGSARVSRISAKSLSDHQTLIVVVGYVMVLFGVMMGPFYLLIDDALQDFADAFPEALLAMIGFADITTPEGWFQTEIFSLSVPVGFIVVTAVMGAKALAGEEANRTMGLLLANPVGRTTVLLEKTAAMTVAAIVLGVLTWVGSMLGSLIAGLGMSAANVAATSALAVLLSLVFGALALAIGAATGSVPAASFGAAGAALFFYIWNAFVPLSEGLGGLARWSPFYYYLTEDPLNDGMPWLHAGILAGLAVGLIALAVVLFRRRDLRQVG